MIKEFALEPDVLATWESFRYFIEKFGVPHGRLIAEFPGKWRRMVIEAAQRVAKPIEFQRIVERLRQVSDHVLLSRGRPGGDGTLPWLDRALAEHAREPFDGIIASANPAAVPYVILQSDVEDGHALFSAPRQIEVERTAVRLVGCAEFMLRHTTTVKWVDYVIDLRRPRWRRPFRAALDVLRAHGRPVIFEVHRQFGNDIEKENLRHQFQEVMQQHRTPGVTFTLHLHPEQLMHDRFILTDRGGIQIGHGLDDNEDGGSAPTANVMLLEQAMFQIQWQRFSAPGSLVLTISP